MWNISKRDERKWQCFVCGKPFASYLDFKEHIIDEHDEGRDYVKCPLARCGAPIRDVRAHFKAIHPKNSVPKNCQLKALIWRDHTGRKKKKVEFNDGYFTSIKNNGAKFHYRSSYELATYEQLELLDEVTQYHGESFKVPYYFNGKQHNYIPDISVLFEDGHVEIWEIKPLNQTSFDKNQAKWKAAAAYCATRGWKFEVYTENGIEKLKKKVRVQNIMKGDNG